MSSRSSEPAKRNSIYASRLAQGPLELGIERLEQRQMLDATVFASGTTATIVGGSGDDTVILNGATISGPNVTVTSSFTSRQGSIRTYRFDMKGGSDTVQVTNVFGFKTITIDGGDGNNIVLVQDSELKQFKVANGTGDDSTQLTNTQIGLDSNANTGLIDIKNGAGGSDVLIESTGPGSGRSLHANRVSIVNGTGDNDIEIRNIRTRRTTFVIGHLAGPNTTTFENVDMTRSIRVIKESTGADTFDGGFVRLSDAQVGSVFVLTSGVTRNLSVSQLRVENGSTVSGSTVHIANSVTISNTTITDSDVNSVRIDHRGETIVGGNVLVDNSRVRGLFQTNHRPRLPSSGLAFLTDGSEFERAFNVRVRGTGAFINIDDATFHGSVNIFTGVGSDLIFIDDSDFFGITRIKTAVGPGDATFDRVAIEQESGSGDTNFFRPIFITTSAADDLFQLGGSSFFTQRVTFHSTLRMDGGAGDDDVTHGNGFFSQGTVSCARIETSTLNC